MFDFGLLTPFPWEDGIEPDAKNDTMEVYVERRFTEQMRTHHGKPLKKAEKWYVALVRFSDGYKAWIISDGIGVLEETFNIEALGVAIDKWKAVLRFNK